MKPLAELSVKRNAQRAFNALATQQLPDGSFVIFNTHGQPDETPAPKLALHAMLLDVLSQSNLPEVERIAGPLAQYLARFLFEAPFTAVLAQTDTRTVFHVLAVLYRHDPALVPPEALASCVRFLTTHELQPGGPYVNVRTHTQRADSDTNLSIARLLYLLGGPFPTLLAHVTRTNKSLYFAAGWAVSLQHKMLAQATGQKMATVHMDTPNSTTDANHTEYFYRDYYASGRPLYGMPAITAARLLLQHNAPPKKSRKQPVADQRAVLLQAEAAVPLQAVSPILNRIIAADQNSEISLFAIRFAKAIHDKHPAPETLQTLGAANLLNWAAYTIYDDILDDEGDNSLLPAANTMMRGAVRLFKTAVNDLDFDTAVDAHFDAVDAANTWEMTHCRFVVTGKTIRIGSLPAYNDLLYVYGRSVTHRLPMMGTLAAIGLPANSNASITLTEAFAQYLTIRQLNDDLHDWRDDLRAGQISYVVARILTDANITAGTYAFSKLLPKLETTFLHTTLAPVATDMLVMAQQARQVADNAGVVEASNILTGLIHAYEQAIRKLLAEHTNGLALLKAFPA